MGKHGESWENMETMENIESMGKIENINQMTKNSMYGHGWKENYIRAWRTLSWVSSRWENMMRNVEPCLQYLVIPPEWRVSLYYQYLYLCFQYFFVPQRLFLGSGGVPCRTLTPPVPLGTLRAHICHQGAEISVVNILHNSNKNRK